MNEAFQKLTEYIHNKYSIPYKQLTRESEIEKDLKITGDDAVEFIDDIFVKFNVQCKRFDYNKYFEPEGFGFINFNKIIGWFIKLPQQPTIKQRLTLGDIEHAITTGVWEEKE
ncbi:DUF1493 family protein [Daejeonella sp.]|uniref:DUF1493 family protein n=1 Tax=Daejeonella sp. TaxID=2805397 RepID=UPI0030BFDC9A